MRSRVAVLWSRGPRSLGPIDMLISDDRAGAAPSLDLAQNQEGSLADGEFQRAGPFRFFFADQR
jgi:hypothetical protein